MVKPGLTESMPITAPVSLKVTGLPGGTGNPYSRGKIRFTTKFRRLDGMQVDVLPNILFKIAGVESFICRRN